MRRSIPLLALLLISITACSSVGSKRGDVYSREEARRTQTVEWATVEHIRPVQIEGTKSGVGAAVGGVAGGVASGSVGGGNGRRVAQVAGAIIGAVIGDAVEDGTTRKQGMEITVRLKSGESMAIVQEGQPEEFFVGQRVRILRGYGNTRVSP